MTEPPDDRQHRADHEPTMWGAPEHPPAGYRPPRDHRSAGPPGAAAPGSGTAAAIRPGQLLLGMLVGWFCSVGALGNGSTSVARLLHSLGIDIGFGPATWIAGCIWAALGVFLLAYPKTRHIGAGFLVGMSVSFIVTAGLCAVIAA